MSACDPGVPMMAKRGRNAADCHSLTADDHNEGRKPPSAGMAFKACVNYKYYVRQADMSVLHKSSGFYCYFKDTVWRPAGLKVVSLVVSARSFLHASYVDILLFTFYLFRDVPRPKLYPTTKQDF